MKHDMQEWGHAAKDVSTQMTPVVMVECAVGLMTCQC